VRLFLVSLFFPATCLLYLIFLLDALPICPLIFFPTNQVASPKFHLPIPNLSVRKTSGIDLQIPAGIVLFAEIVPNLSFSDCVIAKDVLDYDKIPAKKQY